MTHQELQQIELQNQLDLYSRKALHHVRSQRPQNTRKAYANKQQEWEVKYSFPDGALVTEKKLVMFLERKVLYRPIYSTSRYCKKRTKPDGASITQTLENPWH
ncbi:hypothetical protein BDV11DRAFT_178949 [Aspergillus similis]